MPNFIVIQKQTEIFIPKDWIGCSEFKSKGKLFDFSGGPLTCFPSTTNKVGVCRIVAKYQCPFSIFERIKRMFKVFTLLLITFFSSFFFRLGFVSDGVYINYYSRCFKSIKGLFSYKINKRFAIVEDYHPLIGERCYIHDESQGKGCILGQFLLYLICTTSRLHFNLALINKGDKERAVLIVRSSSDPFGHYRIYKNSPEESYSVVLSSTLPMAFLLYQKSPKGDAKFGKIIQAFYWISPNAFTFFKTHRFCLLDESTSEKLQGFIKKNIKIESPVLGELSLTSSSC